MINIDKLKNVIPDSVLTALSGLLQNNKIPDDEDCIAIFLSQCYHESGGFKVVNENLNYSDTRLKAVFPRYFPGNTASNYHRQPEKIGNKIYANRMGNGDEASGDGYKYHGRGYIQLTGKNNYAAFSNFIGEDCVNNPDLVATKYPLESALFYFDNNKLWDVCKLDIDDYAKITKVTRLVNGGNLGLDERYDKYIDFYNLLVDE